MLMHDMLIKKIKKKIEKFKKKNTKTVYLGWPLKQSFINFVYFVA